MKVWQKMRLDFSDFITCFPGLGRRMCQVRISSGIFCDSYQLFNCFKNGKLSQNHFKIRGKTVVIFIGHIKKISNPFSPIKSEAFDLGTGST